MTVAWASAKAAIASFVEATGVVGPDHVVWDRDSYGIVFHESSVELRISEERAVGQDDVEQVEITPGVYSPRITGIREFTLSVRFRARTPADAYAARAALETVRASFHHPLRRQVLTSAGVAFLSTEMLDAREVTFGDRYEILANLDVRMSVQSELYLPAETAGVVESVSASDHGAPPFLIPE